MSDIVERLRSYPLGGLSEPVIRGEAADEIGRLRAALGKIAGTPPMENGEEHFINIARRALEGK